MNNKNYFPYSFLVTRILSRTFCWQPKLVQIKNSYLDRSIVSLSNVMQGNGYLRNLIRQNEFGGISILPKIYWEASNALYSDLSLTLRTPNFCHLRAKNFFLILQRFPWFFCLVGLAAEDRTPDFSIYLDIWYCKEKLNSGPRES